MSKGSSACTQKSRERGFFLCPLSKMSQTESKHTEVNFIFVGIAIVLMCAAATLIAFVHPSLCMAFVHPSLCKDVFIRAFWTEKILFTIALLFVVSSLLFVVFSKRKVD
jgi:hypothetical protein